MLGNRKTAVRIGGVHALKHLAQTHPNEYHDQVVSVLTDFGEYRKNKADRKGDTSRNVTETIDGEPFNGPVDAAAARKVVAQLDREKKKRDQP